MNKQQKINQIKELINAPELPKLPKGIYRETETLMYSHESGVLITYSELKEVSKIASLMVQAITIKGQEQPVIIMVSSFPVGWVEEKTYSPKDIEVIDLNTAENIVKLFNNQ